MRFKTVLVGGALGVSAIAGLSIGLSLESQKKVVYENKISELRQELGDATKIRQDLNIIPPNGKGFIN